MSANIDKQKTTLRRDSNLKRVVIDDLQIFKMLRTRNTKGSVPFEIGEQKH